jgi:hypothetical protein
MELEVFIVDEEPGTMTFKNPKGNQGESLSSSNTPRASPLTTLQDDVVQIRSSRESVASRGLSVARVRISISSCVRIVFTTTTTKREMSRCQ